MSTRKTLRDLQTRCIQRGVKTAGYVGHVRAELDRLARQVRRLYRTEGQFYGDATCIRLTDVLALIREAKQ